MEMRLKRHMYMAASDPNYMKEYMKKRRLERRQKLIDLLGGKCIRCGATENLEFDHIKPKKKEFDIANAKDSPEKVLMKEVKKCQLLCRPCHMSKTRENWEFGGKPARHGTLWMYKKYKCRCKKCRKAMSQYLKKKRSLLTVVRVASMLEKALIAAGATETLQKTS